MENLIILSDGVPVGWLIYKIKSTECHLDLIVLKYEFLGRGYGYSAFQKLYNSIKNNVSIIKLDVQQRNRRAVGFYLRQGFEIISKEEQPVGEGKQIYYNMELKVK
jgi:putative acetyltransferase